MGARGSMRGSWTGRAALGAAVAALLIGGALCHRAERAADIEVEVNGALTTSKYLTTTRPLPTGVLLSSAPTFVSDGTTSEYTTLVIGTVANGYYSRIVSTAERVFYAIPRSGEDSSRPQPTGVVSEAVNTEVHGGATTVHRTRYIRTSLGSHYGQVIERTSSVMPQLESSSQDPGLATLTIGMPVHYPTSAPSVTEAPELNEVPTARRVVQGEEVIIVEEAVQPAPVQNLLPTYIDDGEGPLQLDEPVVVVSNRANFQKTQALLSEQVNKMVKDLNLKEGADRESRDFSDLETIEILDLDLALSGSELTTVTYVGFSDFITTIGSTVVVFMPQSAGAEQIRAKISQTAQFVGPTRTGKSVPLSRAPVFIPNADVITTTRTFASNEAATKTPETESNDVEVEESPVKDDSVLSTASTRVYNTVDLYPTGLVTSIGGTVAREKVTTVFTTLVYGTFIKGRYAKVVKSTSSIYFLVSKTASVEPTAVIQSAATVAVDRGNLGRAVGSGAGAQLIVGSAEEAKAALKQSQQLEGSLAPSTAPALFSSQADGEEEKTVLRTFYTTFTYFTTLSSGDKTEVKTSLSTVTSVATESLPNPALTYFTTFTYFTTSSVDGKEIVSTRYETKSQVVEPTKAPESTVDTLAKLVTKTFFTTYTYFTTSHSGDSSVVQSRLVVSSNVVTSTVPISATATSEEPAHSAAPTSAAPAIQYSTGLLSSLVSSEVNDGVTTISSTGYFGTSIHGLYAQIIKSTTMTVDPALTPSAVQSIEATPVSKIARPSVLSENPSVSATPTVNSPNSGTEPLQISSSAISTSPKELLSSISAQISSSAASSSNLIVSTNRSFLPFRTSNKRKSSGLLALLAAKKGGFTAPESDTDEATEAAPSTTTARPTPAPAVEESPEPEVTEPAPSPVEEEIEPTSTERRFPLRSRRPFPGLRRPGSVLGLRGLFNQNQPKEEEEVAQEEEEEQVTEPAEVEATTVAAEVEEEPIDPTEEAVTEEVIETTTEAVTTQPPRVLAFGRNRAASGTRNALPLRRRPKTGGRGGLVSRFSSATAEEEPTTTTTTTTTTEAATEPPAEPASESAAEPADDEPNRRPLRRFRGRGRGRPSQQAATEPPTEAPEEQPPTEITARRVRGRSRLRLVQQPTTESPTEPPTESPEEEEPTEITARRVGGRGRVRANNQEVQTIRRTVRRRRPIRGRRRRPAEEEDLQSAGSEIYEEYVAAEPLPEHANFFEQNHFLDDAGSEVAEVVAEVDPLQAAADGVILSRTKRQSSFGARSRSRASRGETLSKQETLIETTGSSASSSGSRARRQSRGRTRARNSRQSETASDFDPTPTEDTKEKFTLTSGRSRSRTDSSSSTRRAIPGSRRSRPSDSGGSGGGLAVSLRQRLQQAQLAAAATTEAPRTEPPRVREREPTPVREPPTRVSSSSRRPSQRLPSGSRNRPRQPLFGQDRNREPEPEPEIEIVPTPVLDEGQIIVVSAEQVAVSIPVIADGRTSFRDVFTANTVTNTLELGQYTETEVNGELRTHVGTKTAVGNGGQTELSTLYLSPTEIKTSIRIPTRIRGRVSNVRSTYTQPGFTVVPEVNTIAASQLQPSPTAPNNNNALTALLQQLLASQGQPSPVLQGSFNAPVAAAPQQAFRTVSYTTSYVTTVTESDLTTVPIFFQGRKTHTVIINTDVQVITATEVITSTEAIPGQTVAPAAAFGGLGGLGAFGGLTPQQLLLQQLLNQPPRLQLPAIQPTAARSLLPQTEQPPQLEELLRQATEVDQQQPDSPQQPASTSVVTIFVSGSQPGEFFTRLSTVTLDGPEVTRIKRGQLPTAAVKPTEIPAFIETDQGLFKVPKNAQVFGDLDFYVMSAMNEIEPDMIQLGATQTLESVKWGKATRYREKVIDVAPSLTDRPSLKTDSFLWEGPAESAPLRREKRQATRGRDGSNGNDLSFAPISNDEVRRIAAPEFTTYAFDNTVTDEFGSILVKSTQHVLQKLRTHSNIEFVELTKLGAKPTASDTLLFGILQTEVDPIIKTLTDRDAARKSLGGGKQRGFQTAGGSISRRKNRGRTRNDGRSDSAVQSQAFFNVNRNINPLVPVKQEERSTTATTLRSSIEEKTVFSDQLTQTAPLQQKETPSSSGENSKASPEENTVEDSLESAVPQDTSSRVRFRGPAKPVTLTREETPAKLFIPTAPELDEENAILSDVESSTRGRRVRVQARQRNQQPRGSVTASNQNIQRGVLNVRNGDQSQVTFDGNQKLPVDSATAASTLATRRRGPQRFSPSEITSSVVSVQRQTLLVREDERSRPSPTRRREPDQESTRASVTDNGSTAGSKPTTAAIRDGIASQLFENTEAPATNTAIDVAALTTTSIPVSDPTTISTVSESSKSVSTDLPVDVIDDSEENVIIPRESTTPIPPTTQSVRERRVRVKTRLVKTEQSPNETGTLKSDVGADESAGATTEITLDENDVTDVSIEIQDDENEVKNDVSVATTSRRPSSRSRVVSRLRQRTRTSSSTLSSDSEVSSTTAETPAEDATVDVPQATSAADRRRVRVRARRPITRTSTSTSPTTTESTTDIDTVIETSSNINEVEEIEDTTSDAAATSGTVSDPVTEASVSSGANRSQSGRRTSSTAANPITSRRNLGRRPTVVRTTATQGAGSRRTGASRTPVIRRRPVEQPAESDINASTERATGRTTVIQTTSSSRRGGTRRRITRVKTATTPVEPTTTESSADFTSDSTSTSPDGLFVKTTSTVSSDIGLNVLTARKVPDSRSTVGRIVSTANELVAGLDATESATTEVPTNSRVKKVKKIKKIVSNSGADSENDFEEISESTTVASQSTPSSRLEDVENQTEDTDESTTDSTERTNAARRRKVTRVKSVIVPEAESAADETETSSESPTAERQRVRVTRTRVVAQSTSSAPAVIPRPVTRQRGAGRFRTRPTVSGAERSRQVVTRTRVISQPSSEPDQAALDIATETSTNDIAYDDSASVVDNQEDSESVTSTDETSTTPEAIRLQRKRVKKLKGKKIVGNIQTSEVTTESLSEEETTDSSARLGNRRRVVNVRRRFPATTTGAPNSDIAVDETTTALAEDDITKPTPATVSEGVSESELPVEGTETIETAEELSRDPILFSRFNRRRRPSSATSEQTSDVQSDLTSGRDSGRNRLRRPGSLATTTEASSANLSTEGLTEDVTEAVDIVDETTTSTTTTSTTTTERDANVLDLLSRDRLPFRPSRGPQRQSTSTESELENEITSESADAVEEEEVDGVTTTERSGRLSGFRTRNRLLVSQSAAGEAGGNAATTTERSRSLSGFRSRNRLPLRPNRPGRPLRPESSTLADEQDEAAVTADDEEVSNSPSDTTTERTRGLLRPGGRRPPRPSRPTAPRRPASSTSRIRTPFRPAADENAGLDNDEELESNISGDESPAIGLDSRPGRTRPSLRTSGERRPIRPSSLERPQRPSGLAGRLSSENRLRPALDRSPPGTVPRTVDQSEDEDELSTEDRPAGLLTRPEAAIAEEENEDDVTSFITTTTTERATTVATTPRRIPFFPGLARERSQSRTRRPFADQIRSSVTTRPTLRLDNTPGTRRPLITSASVAVPEDDVQTEETYEESDQSDQTQTDAGLKTNLESTSVEDVLEENLPSNVVYRKFSTVKLVEILGGRQTLTLPVITSTLTTLDPSELHLLTDSPGLFDGTITTAAGEIPAIQVTSTRDRASATRALFGSLPGPSSQNFRPVDATDIFNQLASAVREGASSSARRPALRFPSSTRDQLTLVATKVSSTAGSLVTATEVAQPTTSRRPLFRVPTASANTEQQEDEVTISPATLDTPSSTPDLQSSLDESVLAQEGVIGANDQTIVLASSFSSSARATPSLVLPGQSRFTSAPDFSGPPRTTYRAITSSGTVLIFGELVTGEAINQRGPDLASQRPPFGRTVAAEGVSQVLETSAVVTGIATKVMNNGVPVLVAGGGVPPEQVVSNGQVVFNSGTLTLPPVSLSDVMSLMPSSETDPELGTRGTSGFDQRFYRTQTLYTTFTHLVKRGDQGSVTTSRETVTNVRTVPASAATLLPSTVFDTATYFTTFTYFTTTTRGAQEQVTSSQEVVTRVVVTEAPVAATVAPSAVGGEEEGVTKTYLSTVTLFDTAYISGTQVLRSRSTSIITQLEVEPPPVRPSAVRPPIQATAAPPRRPSVRPPPAVDASLPAVGEQDEIHVVATKTYYTTSTFYTTLLEGSATVVRTRTEVTSRVQTEKVTTRLAASHLSSLRGSLTRPAAQPEAVTTTRSPALGQAEALTVAPAESGPSQSQLTTTEPTPTLLLGESGTVGPVAGQGQSGLQVPEPGTAVESSLAAQGEDLSSASDSDIRVTMIAEGTKPTSPEPTTELFDQASEETTAATIAPVPEITNSPSSTAADTTPPRPSTAALTASPDTTTTTTSTTPAPVTTSTQPPAEALGNLAGSLLSAAGLGAAGLSGLNIGSMVDTAAGLFRNVLPLAVRRDGTSGVPQQDPARPPPAVHVQQRNPAFIPVGGVANSLRREQLATAGPSGPSGPVLAVRGPDGQVIPIRGVPNNGRRPPQRFGEPARRQDRPRRPPPPGGPQRRPLRPNGRPPVRPNNRRNQQQQHQQQRPNGFIAVFPNGQEPPQHGPHEGDLLQLERIEDQPGQPFQFQLRPGGQQGGRRPPFQEFGPAGSTRVHVSITTGAETQFVRPTAADGRPLYTVPQPQPVVVVGATLASEYDNRRVDRPPPDTGAPPTYVEAEFGGDFSNELTGQGFTGQQEFNGGGFADQQGADDQEYAASVQGPFGTGQLTFFDSSDGGFQPDPERRRPIFRPPPPPPPNQVQWPPQSTSTLHTIASLEGDNRIVGTNVFADVVPITTRPAVIRFPPNNRRRPPPPPPQVRPQPSAPIPFPQFTNGPQLILPSPPSPFEASQPDPAPAPVPVSNEISGEVSAPISGQVPVPVSVVIPARDPNPDRPEGVFIRPGTESVISVTTEKAVTESFPSEEPETVSETPGLSDGDDLELAPSTERGQTAKRPQQTSGSISGDEENDKINFIVTSSFESSTTTPSTSRTPTLESTQQPIRLADRIRQTLLASLSSAAAASASASDRDTEEGSTVHFGSSTAILGPDVATLLPDTRTTSRGHSSETVIRGESTVYGGLFTRPALPSESVHDITEIVHGPGHQPVTKYITRTEQFTRTVTATKTDIRFEGSTVVTSTKVITSTLPPITIVSTVIGTSTQIHTLNTATSTHVEPLVTATSATREPPASPSSPPPQPPPRRPEIVTLRDQQRQRERERDRVAVAGVLLADSIDLEGAQQGITDDNEVNRVVLNPGSGQHLVVEQSEAVATRCQRPCLEAIFETCRPMNGEYRCACRPGFARAREEDPCEPTLTYRLQVLLDRVNDIPLSYRPQFADRSSAEYGQLAQLAERGLREALVGTELGERLHTAQLMGFMETPATGEPGRPRTRPPPSLDGLLAEMMVQVSERESESLDRTSLRYTLAEALRSTNYSLGSQQVIVSRHSDAITALDFDECQDGDYNDCHEAAFCYNLAGSFTCSCKDGMVDLNVNQAPGRLCSTESAGCAECSYSGECYTLDARDGGGTGCRCHRWYAGTRCQINLRVLLIALVTVGAVLALMLCACCFLCCRRRRRGRGHVAPPLVFTGPAGFLRHRGTSLGNPVLDRRAMLDSSSENSATSPPRMLGAPPPTGKRAAPVPPAAAPSVAGRSRRSGHTNASFQEERSLASTAIRPAVFIPRAKHRHPQPRPASSASSAVRVGPDGGADLRASQNRLMSVLEPGGRGRARPRSGTFSAGGQRPSRSVSGGRRQRRDEVVSHHPTGRSRSSDSLSLRAESIGGVDADYGAHSFFRERTMSEARSYDETTIRPSVRPMRAYSTQRSRRSSLAASSQGLTYEHHTMAERDAASTFVMPETQLFRPQMDSDAVSEFSVVEDFAHIHSSGRSRAASAAGSRRGLR